MIRSAGKAGDLPPTSGFLAEDATTVATAQSRKQMLAAARLHSSSRECHVLLELAKATIGPVRDVAWLRGIGGDPRDWGGRRVFNL